MKKQVFKLRYISPGPVIIIGALVGFSAVLIPGLPALWLMVSQIPTYGIHIAPATILVVFGACGIAVIVGACLAAILMGAINFALSVSKGMIFEFEVEPDVQAAKAQLPQFAPPPLDPPDPHQRRAQGEQALDATSKILRR